MEDRALTAIKYSTIIIAIAIIIFMLQSLKAIFIPLMFALFFSFLLSPPYRYLVRKKIPKIFALIAIITFVFGLFYIMGILIYFGLVSFTQEFPKYELIIKNYIDKTMNELNIPLSFTKSELELFFKDIDWGQMWDRLSISRIIRTTMGTFADFLTNLLLSLVFLIFILTGKDKMVKAVNKIVSERKYEDYKLNKFMFNRIEKSIVSYFYNKTLISLGTSLVGMFFIYLFGIDFILFSGFMLFFLNFIPNFGSIIASLFPTLFALLEFGIGWQFFSITIVLFLIQFTFGQIIETKILGDSLNISPIVVLISLIFWAWVWGPVGMVFAIPITSVINLVLKEIPSAKVLSTIISGK